MLPFSYSYSCTVMVHHPYSFWFTSPSLYNIQTNDLFLVPQELFAVVFLGHIQSERQQHHLHEDLTASNRPAAYLN